MKNILIILVGVWITYSIFSGDDSTSPSKSLSIEIKQPTSSLPAACNQETFITGEQLNVIGTEINVRSGPGTTFDKIINQKATAILDGTHYVSIDDSTIVFEECTKGDWSWVRVVQPDYLKDSHRGWVLSNFLDKGQDLGGDPYVRKISSSAIIPYEAKSYPKTVEKYGSRLEEIERLRRRAAEMAVDSGKCDFAQWVELSESRSTLEHLHFWIDCRNGQRIYLDEFEIKDDGQVLTQQDNLRIK